MITKMEFNGKTNWIIFGALLLFGAFHLISTFGLWSIVLIIESLVIIASLMVMQVNSSFGYHKEKDNSFHDTLFIFTIAVLYMLSLTVLPYNDIIFSQGLVMSVLGGFTATYLLYKAL